MPSSRLPRLARRGTLAAVVALALGFGAPAASPAPDASTALLQRYGLAFQDSAGFLGAEGPAAQVARASEALMAGHVDSTALYTGAGATGTGFLVVSVGEQPPTLDIQVMGMTAANVENNSDQLDAVYSDVGGRLDAVVPAHRDVDVAPVDVDYAVYPPGYDPPPDNHGLDPTALFDF